MSQLRRLRRLHKPAVLVACKRECELDDRECEGGPTYWMYGGRRAVFVLCCAHAYRAYGCTELSGPAEFEELKLALDVMES